MGCRNVDRHPRGKAYLAHRRHSCDRRECPDDYGAWAAKEARHAARRVWRGLEVVQDGLPVHFTLSPPQDAAFDTARAWAQLKHDAYRIAERAGYNGGAMVFHPWRCKDGLEDGPHFHGMGPGWNEAVAEIFASTGWVVKRIRPLKTEEEVRTVIAYCLSHCGIAVNGTTGKPLQALTWYGTFSYSKLRLEPEVEIPAPEDLCPYCGGATENLIWLGKGQPPPVDGLVDSELVGASPDWALRAILEDERRGRRSMRPEDPDASAYFGPGVDL